jgi:hypothetical protein
MVQSQGWEEVKKAHRMGVASWIVEYFNEIVRNYKARPAPAYT